ncbi:MAG: hypothetical protein H6R07_2181 [Proteobacteria bacterium]|nr:hypothetical protein [Pseudomonadota bacterium]
MVKRNLVTMLAVSIAISALTACGGDSASDSSSSAATGSSPGSDSSASTFPAAATPTLPSTPITNGALTESVAAYYTAANVLGTAKTDTSVAGAVTDGWSPEADAFMAATATSSTSVTPDYTVDAAQTADGATKFTSIQAAINKAALDAVKAGRTSRIYIRVAPGTYNELVYVPSVTLKDASGVALKDSYGRTVNTPITLYSTASDASLTKISYAINASIKGNAYPNLNVGGKAISTLYSSDPAVTDADIYSFYNACAAKGTSSISTTCSTVMWIKNTGFQMKGITVENSNDESKTTAALGAISGSSDDTQAVALEVDSADKVHLENVRMLGNQDTFYVKTSKAGDPANGVYANISRVFVNKSYVEGDIDFIFGRGTILFKKSEIKYLGARNKSSGYITAPSTDKNVPYGLVFIDSDFTHDGQGDLVKNGKVPLVRQWFEGIKCSPYLADGSIDTSGKALAHGYTCTLGSTDAADSTAKTGTYTKAVLDRVGKLIVRDSRLGSHIDKSTPFADWNASSSTAYRPVQAYNKETNEVWLGLYNNTSLSAPATAAAAPVGWASAGTGTTGGTGADSAHVYTVTNRNELINALYTGAVINDDGSFSGTQDNAKKIINVVGTISLNMNKALTELTGDDYLKAGACSYTALDKLYTAYYAAYAPNVWNTTLASNGKPNAVSGAEESARVCGAAIQKNVVVLNVGSNTTIQSKDGSGKIIHGNLILPAGSDNIIVRNMKFEDSFDFFPQWDPTDSFPTVTATASTSTTTGIGCSTSAPTKCIGGRWNSAYDLVSVLGATHVWLDHNTMSDGANHDKLYGPVSTWDFGGNAQIAEQKVQHHDGLIDITKASNYVTVSYNHFLDHDKTGLIGGTDTASLTAENPLALKVTFHGNYYKNNKQRQPRVRFGQVHLFNNYYEGQLANSDGSGLDYPWSVAWTAGTASKLWVENNVVEIAASPDASKSASLSNVIGISTSASNATKCKSVSGKTWTDADCATYFYDKGNLFNSSAVADYGFYDAIQLLVTASSSSAPIAKTDTFWTPSASYSYTPLSASAVKLDVLSNAGAGKVTLP